MAIGSAKSFGIRKIWIICQNRDFKVNPNDDKLNLPDDPEPRVELKAKGTKLKIQF